jgi:hypothetical protein
MYHPEPGTALLREPSANDRRRREQEVMSRLGKTQSRVLAAVVATFMMLAVAVAVPTSAGATGHGGKGSAVVPAAEDLFESSMIRGVNEEGQRVQATATPVRFEVVDGQLVADVLVKAVARGNGATPEVDWALEQDVAVTVNTVEGMGAGGPGMAGASSHGCDILNLELGATEIDLLGLVIDLSQVNLDIVAESGAGNLLGNLLCAVAGLLDSNPLDAALAGLLDSINGLLDQLLGGLLGSLSL